MTIIRTIGHLEFGEYERYGGEEQRQQITSFFYWAKELRAVRVLFCCQSSNIWS